MNGLMLDTPKSGTVSYEQVIGIPTPLKTRTYQPVPHVDFIGLLADMLGYFGLETDTPVDGWNYGVAADSQQLFGTVGLVGQNHCGDAVKLMLGFRNSYDKSLSAGICFGSQVFVCSNLCFTGYAGADNEVFGTVFHKHTTNVMPIFEERVKVALSQFDAFRTFQEKFYNRLQETPLNQDKAYATIVRAVKAGAVPNKDVCHLAAKWDFQADVPEVEDENNVWYPEFQDRNAWSLHNTFTEIAKDFQSKNLVAASNRGIATSKFFYDEFCNEVAVA
jgi:hypothetical protein